MIRSDERLDYPQVDRIFAGEERARGAVGGAAGGRAARRPRRSTPRASARGALAVESVEPEFDFAREGHVTGLVRRASRPSRTG